MLPNFLYTEVTAWVGVTVSIKTSVLTMLSPVCTWKPAGMEHWWRQVARHSSCQQLWMKRSSASDLSNTLISSACICVLLLLLQCPIQTDCCRHCIAMRVLYIINIYVSIIIHIYISPLSLRYFMLGRFMHFIFSLSLWSWFPRPWTNYVALLSTLSINFLSFWKHSDQTFPNSKSVNEVTQEQ